eukprot:TRINITY_DN7530_c0_g1_i2.p1 TRINITY_DN7530_c0_g1~~TRINITY_DN7530_c0_g1_i2.p1  ORF type:complete len:183 (+),score=50.54 TRINITY_DN7530_c0_g1_i2:296-844(+)
MTVRPSRVLHSWAGSKGAVAPTKGLGRFFQRTKTVMALEPMYSPHRVHWDAPHDMWNHGAFTNYNLVVKCLLIFFVVGPAINTLGYYIERTHSPNRVPLPGKLSVYTDIDDPDWRLKLEMWNKEKREGPRPFGYNRYLDVMKDVKVSHPDYKLYVPSEHGEGVGANASDIIAREKAQQGLRS